MLTGFSGDSVTFTEGDPYVLLDQNLPAAIADPDNQNFAGGSFSIGVQINPSAEDELYILNLGPVGTVGNDVYVEGTLIGTIAGQGPGPLLTVSFNEDATPDLVTELVDFIAYRNLAGDDPTAGSRSITYLLNDGDGGATAGGVTVDVAAVNDAPGITITLPGGAPMGGEVKINSGATGDEGNSSITALPDGGYVVVWWGGPTQGGMNADIYARRFDAAGVAQGADVRVNASSVDDLFNPSVSVLSDGGYVVVWDSYEGVYARRFDASGTAQGNEIRVLTSFGNELLDADVAGLSGGGFVVTWQASNKDGSGKAVMAQRYDATGAALGGQVQINSFTSNDQYAPSVTGLSDGSYVVAWTSYQTNGPGAGIYARHYSAAGVAQGIEFLVNTTNAGHQQMPSVSALPGGGFAVAWQSSDIYGGAVHVHAQRFDAANARQGGEIDVAPASGLTNPTIIGLTDGDLLVTWTSAGNIYARRYDASGAALDLATLVNSATAGGQHDPSAAALAGGDYIITWNIFVDGGPEPHGISAQRYGDGYYAIEQFATNLKQSILLSDADAGAGTISVTLAVTSGLLAVSAGSSGASVSGGGGSASVTITGTLAQVNALLNTNATSFILLQ